MKNTRRSYLDNIRWGVQIFVVLYHVFYMYNAEGVGGGLGKITSLDVQWYDMFQYIVYPWLMPILFLVSGISSRLYLEGHTHKEFISSRTTKLLVPCTIGLFAFQFIQGYVSMALNDAIDQMPVVAPVIALPLSGLGVLWTIQMLWLFSLLLVLVRKVEKDKLWDLGAKADLPALLMMFVPVWLSSLVLNTPVITVYRFGLYGMYFFLGYFVFSHQEVIERMKERLVFLILPAVVTGIAFCAVYFGQNYADAPVYKKVLFTSYGWFACLAIVAAAAKYLDYTNKGFEWMRKRGFGLYVFHYLGISSVALFIAKPALLPAPAVYVISIIAGFAAGFVLNEIISRLPFFRWAVLGIRRKKDVR
ncbi:MAG: acyltransferase [Oscillospiraceae bacterium]|nr:acyltransferase [Oscillospiraceae bacterium]